MSHSRLYKLGLIVLVLTLISTTSIALAGGPKGGQPVAYTGTLYDSAFPAQVATTGTGWAVGRSGNSGVILKQASSGTWNVAQSTGGDLLNSMIMTNASSGYAVGSGGKIYEFDSGSNAWKKIKKTPTSRNLNNVNLGASGYVIALGDAGTVLIRWDDGKWYNYPNTPTSTNALYGGMMVANGTSWAGFVVGQNKTVWRCDCNATVQNWTVINTGITQTLDFKDIYMSDLTNGYVVATDGTLVSVTNGVWAVVPGINVGSGKAVIDFRGTGGYRPSGALPGGLLAGSARTAGFTAIAPLAATASPTDTMVLVLGNDPITGAGKTVSMDRGGSWSINSMGTTASMTYMKQDTSGLIWATGDRGTLIVMDRGGSWSIN